MCETGRFREIGIKGAHGAMRAHITEAPERLIPIPKEARSYAVLTEPMSVVAKGLRHTFLIQKRLVWTPRRALILGAMAEGETLIDNLAAGDDVRATKKCLKAMGVAISPRGARVVVRGLGFKRLRQPEGRLDAGNSGTTMRLLMGVTAGNRVKAETIS